MSVLASSAVLMSHWCPLWEEEQKPCCPATGEECWRRSFSWCPPLGKIGIKLLKRAMMWENFNAKVGKDGYIKRGTIWIIIRLQNQDGSWLSPYTIFISTLKYRHKDSMSPLFNNCEVDVCVCCFLSHI